MLHKIYLGVVMKQAKNKTTTKQKTYDLKPKCHVLINKWYCTNFAQWDLFFKTGKDLPFDRKIFRIKPQYSFLTVK